MPELFSSSTPRRLTHFLRRNNTLATTSESASASITISILIIRPNQRAGLSVYAELRDVVGTCYARQDSKPFTVIDRIETEDHEATIEISQQALSV